MEDIKALGFLLHDVARLLRKRFEQRARTFGLTRSQWQALAYLNRNEGIQQRSLADLLEIEPVTAGRILDRLEEHDLIERRPHPTDRRAWLLYLRERAHPLIEEMLVIGEATRGEALVGLADADRRQLMAALSTMKSNLISACAQTPDIREVVNG